MITNKKLLILWGIIVVAYAAIMVFTWPGLTVPPEKRTAIYAEYVDAVAASDCHAPDPEILAIADEFQVTHREAVFSVREGFKADNTADPCGRYYP
jgi:hypothetical protein